MHLKGFLINREHAKINPLINKSIETMDWIVTQPSSLLEALVGFAPESSKNTVRSWIKQGRIELDEQVVKDPTYKVKSGQKLGLGKKKHFIDHDVEVLFEDRSLIVVYKPEGILSVSTDYDKFFNVHGFLKRRMPSGRVYPVHRLDRETSGVMMFAYTEEARDHLKKQFEGHTIQRQYLAIVEGTVSEEQGMWRSYLQEDEQYVVSSTPNPLRGKLAVTHFKVLQRHRHTTTLELTLETGKKNQIRVHCREAGHPVVGDKKYGAKTSFCKRLYLHALQLGFLHPATKKTMVFERKPSEEFYAGLHKKAFATPAPR